MTKEEAIEVYKELINPRIKEAFDVFAPELAESEDERIRKDIIAFLQSMNSHCEPAQDWDLRNRWLPYLEKQKEPNIEHIQRSWYMEGYYDRDFGKEPRWIIKTGDGGPRYEDNPRYGEDKKEQKPSTPKTSIEILKHYLVWAINDDNDCPYTWEQLANAIKDGIAALEQKPAEWSERDEKILASVMSHIADGQCFDHFHDISKEDIYTWLKSLRPQPKCEWDEEYREEDVQTRFAFYTYKDDPSVLYLSNVFVEEASRNHGFGARILKAAEKAAKAIGATTIRLKVKQDSQANVWYRKNGYGYMTFEDGYDWLEKNLEYMKPTEQEWSEEDENMRKACIAFIGDDIFKKYEKSYECIAWLKNLRPQPRQEWSEEDEENFKWFDKFFRAESVVAGGRDIPQDRYLWFKSFRNRPKATDNWKPSEEQMEWLESAVKLSTDKPHIHGIIISLYEQLKRL